MRTATRHAPLSWTGFLAALLAVLLLVGGVVLEIGLQRETARARYDLSSALARAHHAPETSIANAHATANATRRARAAARELVSARRPAEAAARLDAWALETATAEAHTEAALAARAAGRFDLAARHADFTSRLAPRDPDLARAREQALDLAVLARVRPFARVLAAVAALLLVGGALRRRTEKRRRRRRDRWVEGLHAALKTSVDGGGRVVDDDLVRIGPDTTSLVIDLFLTQRGAPRAAPRPGPTLSLALSQASSNRTMRLTPRRDVRDDAVRIRLKEETLYRLLASPGSWRLQARLDSRLVAEAWIEVRDGRSPFARGLRILQPV